MTSDDQVDTSKETHVEIQSKSQTATDDARLAADKADSDIIPSSLSNPDVSSNNDSDQQQEAFHIVLVDIRKTTRWSISCVSKPLYDKDIKFVAISYRWGEVQEQVVDTGLDYMAIITSFYLADFADLCAEILQEPDLRSMDYVWVDAICVDQSNHARRKATIYQMSNIYERANYILAVPDLYLRFYRESNTVNKTALQNVYENRRYIYNLLHGNVDNLVESDKKWFDERGIPQDSEPRQALAKYKSRLVDCLQEYSNKKYPSNGDLTKKFSNLLIGIQRELEDAGYTSPLREDKLYFDRCSRCKYDICTCDLEKTLASENGSIPHEKLLHSLLQKTQNVRWTGQIIERCREIKQAIRFLADLVTDWSSRAWVISEFHIAKKKNSRKLKYWFSSMSFIGINRGDCYHLLGQHGFFVFDFDKRTLPNQETWANSFEKHFDHDILLAQAVSVYEDFHLNMTYQLSQQSFLRMMLKSKASRNEDRFYAIFPNSNYKHKLESKDVVASWQINGILSVKLKLYEIMSTKDKLMLLFYSGTSELRNCTMYLPLFATVDITWNKMSVTYGSIDDNLCNFDLDNDTACQMIPLNASDDDDHENGITTLRYKLSLVPKIFYTGRRQYPIDHEHFNSTFAKQKRLFDFLDVDWEFEKFFVVCIPMDVQKFESDPRTWNFGFYLYLVGSFDENKWLFASPLIFNAYGCIWDTQYNDNENTSFDIY